MSPHFTEKQNGSLERLIVLYKARIEARQCERSNQICLVMEKGHKDIHVRSLAIPEVDCVIICTEQELSMAGHSLIVRGTQFPEIQNQPNNLSQL